VCFPFIYKIHANKFTEDVMDKISRSAYIISPLKTLEIIQCFIEENKPGAYMRFGDGDVFVATGKNALLHTSTKQLREEMNESFAMKGTGIIKALSIHSEVYGCEKEMYVGNFMLKERVVNDILHHTYPFFVGHQVYSPIALHYAAIYYPETANQFLKVLKKQTILFIGNENTPREVVTQLFGEVKHIKAPEINSYAKIDVIEKETEEILANNKKFGVVITSMGEAGRVLMKRLYKKHYDIFIFDFGSLLDGICGNETRTWLRKANINYEILLKDL
jgi:hypothetical protein